MRGFPTLSTLYKAVIKKMIPPWEVQIKRGGGITSMWSEGYDKPSNEPERVAEPDELQGLHRLTNTYVS